MDWYDDPADYLDHDVGAFVDVGVRHGMKSTRGCAGRKEGVLAPKKFKYAQIDLILHVPPDTNSGKYDCPNRESPTSRTPSTKFLERHAYRLLPH